MRSYTLFHPAGKMYIQDKVEEYADEVFDLLVRHVPTDFHDHGLKPAMGAPAPQLDRYPSRSCCPTVASVANMWLC